MTLMKHRVKSGLLSATCLLLLFSCELKRYDSPPGYDFSEPEKIIMRESLLEISGIAFHHGNPDTVLAINDEDGRLCFFPIDKKKAYATKFSKNGDFEDVAVYKHLIYTLRSDGTLFSFSDSIKQKKVKARKWENVFPKGEYESLCALETDDKLYTLCKKCGKEKHIIQGYTLDLADTSGSKVASFQVDLSGMSSLAGKVKRAFQPSALALHPLTGEWYILSSVHKTLLIADAAWKPKAAYALDPKYFNQPEGMAFDDVGHLYISNEGNEIQNGNIMRFAFVQ